MMNLNIDRLMDLAIEARNDEMYYRQACQEYKAKHHCSQVWCGDQNDPEIRHILYLNNWADKSRDIVWAISEVLDMDQEERDRVWLAARALHRWYERTSWERCPDYRMLDQLQQYIFQA